MGPVNKVIPYEGQPVYYRVSGEGSPVILVHGFGEDGSVWEEQVRYLQNRFRLIVPDLPGSGDSPIIPDMSMEGLAEVIHAIILAEGMDACPVIGHSMGGYITLALVEKYGTQVSAFGLVHSTAYADSDEKKANRLKGIRFVEEHGAWPFLQTSIPNLFSPRSRDEMPEKIAGFTRGQHNFSARALVVYYQAMMARPDRTRLLEQATVPVLFILGEYDNAVPLADGLKQCHLPEKSYIHILAASGHMGMMEEAGKMNRALEEFLSALR